MENTKVCCPICGSLTVYYKRRKKHRFKCPNNECGTHLEIDGELIFIDSTLKRENENWILYRYKRLSFDDINTLAKGKKIVLKEPESESQYVTSEKQQKMSPIVKFGGGFLLFCIFLVILAEIGIIQREEKPKTSSPDISRKKDANETLEYKLAVIDEGGFVSKDHVSVARFKSLLRQLSDTFVENEQQISDMSVRAQQILREDGIRESIINIMEGLNRIFLSKVENQKYAEYSAVYLTLRTKGQSHQDAIEGLKALIQSLGLY